MQLYDRLRKSYAIQNEALNEINDRLEVLRNRKIAVMVKGPKFIKKLRENREKYEEKFFSKWRKNIEKNKIKSKMKMKTKDPLKDSIEGNFNEYETVIVSQTPDINYVNYDSFESSLDNIVA